MRPIFSALLIAAFLPLSALAVDNNWFNWNTDRQFDYSETPTGATWGLTYRKLLAGVDTLAIIPRDSSPRWAWPLRYGPPGHQDRVLPEAELWCYCVAESGLGWSASLAVCEWRWVQWYPGDPATKYYGAWTQSLDTVQVNDTLYYAPLWGSDTLGWFNDVQFRIRGLATNDSSYVSLGVERRTWK